MIPSVLVFDRDGNLASLQRSVLRGMGCAKNGLVATEKALLKELVIGRDIVLLNWNEDWSELVALVKTVRNKSTSPDPFVSLIVISSSLSDAHSREVLDAGVNSLMRVPFSAGDVIAHVRYVSEKSWSFIDAPDYFGPDRRRRLELHAHGERRVEQCYLLSGAELATERARMRETALKAFDIKVAQAS